MTVENSFTEQLSPIDKYEFTPGGLVNLVPPVDRPDENYFYAQQAFGRLIHAGFPMVEIIGRIESEIFHATFGIKEAAQLMRDRPSYFGELTDAHQRLFLASATNLSEARLKNQLAIISIVLGDFDDNERLQLEEEYLNLILFQNSI